MSAVHSYFYKSNSTVEKRREMVIKVAVADRFRFKMVPSIKNLYMLGSKEVHYIGGAEVLPAPLDTDEEKNVLAMLKTEDDDYAKKMLIEHNLRLVVYIAKKFDNTGVGVEDLISIGTIGLIKAIDKFDDSFDVRFSTYAVPMIAGEIKRFLRDDGMLKVSRSIKENGYRIKRASDELVSKNGREATVEELAAATELSVEDVVMALDAGTDVESIYRTVYQGDGSEIFLVDKITSADNVSSSEGSLPQQEKMLDMIMLRQLLEELDETERKLISLRYFKEMTQSAVANELGISQVQVSRLEKKILQKLRKNIF